MKTIGELIKEFRKSKKITRTKLAAKAGIPYPTLRDMERRGAFGHKENIEKVFNYLNVDIQLVEKEPTREEKTV